MVSIAIAFIAISVIAQDTSRVKIRVGLYANAGTSSLVQGMGMNMNMYSGGAGGYNSSNMTMYNYVGSWGGGVNLILPLHQRWSLVGNVGYMNRGANYSESYSSNEFGYRFSYLDVAVMGQYNSLPKGAVKFTAVLGLTESTLLAANAHSSGTNQNMMDNVNRADVGMVLGPGLEVGLKEKAALQVRLLYTYGFMNVFRGMYSTNGMDSNNAAFLLQIGYLFR